MVGRAKPPPSVSRNQAVDWFAKKPGKHHQKIERLPTAFQVGQGSECCIGRCVELSAWLEEKNGVCMRFEAGSPQVFLRCL